MDLIKSFAEKNLNFYYIKTEDNYIGIVCKKNKGKTCVVGFVREEEKEYVADLKNQKIKIKRL
jgi:hypothetical protein